MWKDIVRVCIVLKTRIARDTAGRKKTNLTKENQAVNSYVKLDIEWNISDFICKEK